MRPGHLLGRDRLGTTGLRRQTAALRFQMCNAQRTPYWLAVSPPLALQTCSAPESRSAQTNAAQEKLDNTKWCGSQWYTRAKMTVSVEDLVAPLGRRHITF